MQVDRRWIALGAILAGVGIALGAFGAHALKSRVSSDLIAVYETGSRYHLYHAQGLMLLGLLAPYSTPAWIRRAGIGLTLGIVLFSGSLYLMTVTGVRMLGAVTPFGGISFMAGWACLAVGVWQGRDEHSEPQ